MDRHICNSYANAFADSNYDGYPKPKRHANCYRVRLCVSDCHRQSDPVRDSHAFTVSNFLTHNYTCIAKPEPFCQTGQSFSARDAASPS
jgi:hypothetical protein